MFNVIACDRTLYMYILYRAQALNRKSSTGSIFDLVRDFLQVYRRLP